MWHKKPLPLVKKILTSTLSAFPIIRHLFWKIVYKVLGYIFGKMSDTEFKQQFLNYGYDAISPEEKIQLAPEDEAHRYNMQLYHKVLNGQETLHQKKILEVSCAYGYGCYYIKKYFNPELLIGVDLTASAIEFCQKNFSTPGSVEFKVANAEKLPFDDEYFDLILNIEASHCYPSFQRFIAEAFRVLKNQGNLAWADLWDAKSLDDLRKICVTAGFTVLREENITGQVLSALDKMSEGRSKLVSNKIPKLLQGLFCDLIGITGSYIYERLKNQDLAYVCLYLQKDVDS